jgi:hypothetical protein
MPTSQKASDTVRYEDGQFTGSERFSKVWRSWGSRSRERTQQPRHEGVLGGMRRLIGMQQPL